MTSPREERFEESTNRTSGDWSDVARRPLLRALGAGAAVSVGGVATAGGTGDDQGRVDQPEGFEAEVVAPHATFSDDVAAALGVVYRDGATELAFVPDASTVLIVRARLEPGGTSGWHLERGPALVNVVEGEVDITFEVDEGECVTRTYAAGEAGIATGRHADNVENASDTEPAMAYIIVFGVPAGEPPSTPVEPPDC